MMEVASVATKRSPDRDAKNLDPLI